MLIQLKCENCGASSLDIQENIATCKYCKSQYKVKDINNQEVPKEYKETIKSDMSNLKVNNSIIRGDMNNITGNYNIIIGDMNTVRGIGNIVKGDMNNYSEE